MKKKYRILKNEEFQELIQTGAKQVNSSFVFYYLPKKNEDARIGISLSKKTGNAVVRNYFKRQVRMMCQECIDFSSFPYDGVLITRKDYPTLSYADNKKNLEKVLNKATIK